MPENHERTIDFTRWALVTGKRTVVMCASAKKAKALAEEAFNALVGDLPLLSLRHHDLLLRNGSGEVRFVWTELDKLRGLTFHALYLDEHGPVDTVRSGYTGDIIFSFS